jgi:hypothetical protein
MTYVFTASGDGFVGSILSALKTKVDLEQIQRFVKANTWDSRVDALASWVGVAPLDNDALDGVISTG